MLLVTLATVSLHLAPVAHLPTLSPAASSANDISLPLGKTCISASRCITHPVMSLGSTALAVNAAAYALRQLQLRVEHESPSLLTVDGWSHLTCHRYTANGVFYLSPLRNGVIKDLFGIEHADFFSPVSGAFLYLGGMHAALALQCIGALIGKRSARDTLALMLAVHAIQASIGIWRMLASRAASKASGLWELLGAGGGPATAATLMGAFSWAALTTL